MPDSSSTPAHITQDNLVIPFFLEHANSSGRIVRLGETVQKIIRGHNYPAPVAWLLSEAIALTALLGSALKTEGRLILQTQSDGPVRMMVVDYRVPGEMRGYVRFDHDQLGTTEDRKAFTEQDYDSAGLLGKGHLALTIDPGNRQERRQGIVALDNVSLTEAAEHYFEQSEQVSTFLRLSVARVYQKGNDGPDSGLGWRAGGILVQKMGFGGGHDDAAPENTIGERAQSAIRQDEGGYEEDWNRVHALAATVENHELLDPQPALENLLYNLFHEENVRVLPGSSIKAKCTCSPERTISVMRNFTRAELAEMYEEDGNISVACEFCGSRYSISPEQLKK